MSNQGRYSTNPRGRGGRGSPLPHPYRGNSHGRSRSPVYQDLLEELDRQKEKNASLGQQNQNLTTENGQLKEQVVEEQDKCRSENNQKENIRSELTELQSKYVADQKTIGVHNEEWAKLAKEKKDLEVLLKKVIASSSSSSEEYHLLEADHDQTLKELDAVREKCANLDSTNLAQTVHIKDVEQACQNWASRLNEQTAENVHLKEQSDQQQLEITRLQSHLENRTDEIVALRQEVAGLQQPRTQDSPASQALNVIGTNTDEQAVVHSLIDEVANQVNKWNSDLETPGAAVEAQGNDIKQFAPQPGKVSEAATSQDIALKDDEISAASMEVYSKLVRRSKARNKANLEACIKLCNHLNIGPGRLRRALEKRVPDPSHDLDIEELTAELKRLHAEDAATMQSARGILKNASITEATLRDLPGKVQANELQDVVDTILSKWQAKGASAAHTGSRGAGGNAQPAQCSATDAEAQTNASPDSSHAATQTTPVESTTYVDIGVQHDAAVQKRPDYVESIVQTEPDNIQHSDNALDYTNKGTQTPPRHPPNRFLPTLLSSLFILLCAGFLAWAISSQLDALRERAMWLDANDMSRRATIYFIDASAHGRRQGWLWRPSALNHIEKPYLYAESMVGFGVIVQ